MNPGANGLNRSSCNPINYGILTGFSAAREYKPKTCTVLDFKTNHGLQRGLRRMDEPQIYQRLTEIFQDVFDEDSIEVTPKLSADDVDGWDSLTHIRLILTIEKVFKIRFSTSEIAKLENVGALAALIQGKV